MEVDDTIKEELFESIKETEDWGKKLEQLMPKIWGIDGSTNDTIDETIDVNDNIDKAIDANDTIDETTDDTIDEAIDTDDIVDETTNANNTIDETTDANDTIDDYKTASETMHGTTDETKDMDKGKKGESRVGR